MSMLQQPKEREAGLKEEEEVTERKKGVLQYPPGSSSSTGFFICSLDHQLSQAWQTQSEITENVQVFRGQKKAQISSPPLLNF